MEDPKNGQENKKADVYLTVVCPMYNEGAKIQSNLVNLLRVLDTQYGKRFEVILVDDGSTDNSLEEAKKVAERDPRLIVISYKKNRGRGYALRRGFAEARGEILATVESDMNYGETIVKDMVDELEAEGLDMAVASPYAPGGKLINVPTVRIFFSRFGNYLLRFLMPGNLTTYTGMTRVYRRYVLEMIDLKEDRKEIHLEIITKATALGFEIGEVPATLTWEPARKGKKRKSSFNARKLIVSHLLLGFSEFPLILFGSISAGLLLVASIAGIYMLIKSLSGIPQAGRPLLLITVLLILAAIQILLFCFMSYQIRDMKRHLVRLQGDLRKKAYKDT